VSDLDGLRSRAGLATDIETVREIERISATRFIDTGLNIGEPTDVDSLTERLAMGDLIVACEGDDNLVGFVMFCEVDGGAARS
jgi:predicted N-acetyltransferase YhbS